MLQNFLSNTKTSINKCYINSEFIAMIADCLSLRQKQGVRWEKRRIIKALRLFVCSRKTYLHSVFIMAADCLRLLIILLEATNTSNQLGTKFNDWKCFFVRFKHRISDWWIHDLLQKQRAQSKDIGELRTHAAALWKMVQRWVEYHASWSGNGECNQKVYHQFARARQIHIL